MDWLIILCLLLLICVMYYKVYKIKKDVYDFADKLEKNLDDILLGKEISELEEDTVLAKLNDKINTVIKIWKDKEQKSFQQKQQLKELISDISHQTRTPIANQKIYLEILREELKQENLAEVNDKLEHQTDKLDLLFKSMVNMSRLENGIIQIEKRNLNIIDTLSRAISGVVAFALKKQIRISVKAPENLIVPHDKKWTEEAIYNILDNAVKYTLNGGEIEIILKKNEIFTEIHVKDNGKGICLEHQAQIFKRFYREPDVHDKDGLGIGLYLSRKIIELQNGYIELYSEVGKGSDFKIYLPNK